MFIEIRKVIEERAKAEDGSLIKDPISNKPVRGEMKIAVETIRIDEIKASRPWDKDREQEIHIEGPMTKIYLFGDRSRKSNPEILIQEDYNSFSDRLGTTRLENGEKE